MRLSAFVGILFTWLTVGEGIEWSPAPAINTQDTPHDNAHGLIPYHGEAGGVNATVRGLGGFMFTSIKGDHLFSFVQTGTKIAPWRTDIVVEFGVPVSHLRFFFNSILRYTILGNFTVTLTSGEVLTNRNFHLSEVSYLQKVTVRKIIHAVRASSWDKLGSGYVELSDIPSNSLITKVRFQLLGRNKENTGETAQIGVYVPQKFPNPASGAEYKTLLLLEMKGGFDSAAAFISKKTQEEINTFCQKRPNLAKEFCQCIGTGADGECSTYSLKNVHDLANTDGHLAMTNVLASNGLLDLWNNRKMAVIPGIGRKDHSRSHFSSMDAAAKGVSVAEEYATKHGFLARSIKAANSMFSDTKPDGLLPHGISLGASANGPHSLLVSDRSIINETNFRHVTGIVDIDDVLTTPSRYYTPVDPSNEGLSHIAHLENSITTSLEAFKEKVSLHYDIFSLCPGFPTDDKWYSSTDSSKLGIQFRNAAVMLAHGITPRVFQLQQVGYDTHAGQLTTLNNLLSDLSKFVSTFMIAAETCGFHHDVLIATMTEFGRRIEENSVAGTDHGWASYGMLFGTELSSQVIGFNEEFDSASLNDIIPQYTRSLGRPEAYGDLEVTTQNYYFQACVLDSLGLPSLTRLGGCPDAMRFRSGLTSLPFVSDADFFSVGGAGSLVPDQVAPNRKLSPDEVIHFSRRVGFNPDVSGLPIDPAESIDIDEAINQVLSDSPPSYIPYYTRHPGSLPSGIILRTAEERHWNIWDSLLKLQYPRVDTIESRIARWGLSQYFNLSTLQHPTSEKDFHKGNLDLSVFGSGKEEEIRDILTEKTIGDVRIIPYQKGSGSLSQAESNLIDSETGKLKNPRQINWYHTLAATPDVLLSIGKTVDDIVADYNTPECNFTDLLIVDSKSQTAFLRRPGLGSSADTLKVCSRVQGWQYWASYYQTITLNYLVEGNLMSHQYNFEAVTLCQRMTWFFMNHYASPKGDVKDILLLAKQYWTLRQNCLGNYSDLSHLMFVDGALRQSLGQARGSCSQAPTENFAREWFELFTVGVGAHNEGDVKRLAKGLQNCDGLWPSLKDDIINSGFIFDNAPDEALSVISPDERAAAINKILNYRPLSTEPPAAAQYFCRKLYDEFSLLSQGEPLNSLGNPGSIIDCASAFYGSGYSIKKALETVFKSKNFIDGLGSKVRWPINIILGALADVNMPKKHTPVQAIEAQAMLVGMPFFTPPDVAGWHRSDVWTQDALLNLHTALESFVSGTIKTKVWNDSDFNSLENFRNAFSQYELKDQPGSFSLTPKVCGSGYVELQGKLNSHIFVYDSAQNSQFNQIAWLTAVQNALTNICNFVA